MRTTIRSEVEVHKYGAERLAFDVMPFGVLRSPFARHLGSVASDAFVRGVAGGAASQAVSAIGRSMFRRNAPTIIRAAKRRRAPTRTGGFFPVGGITQELKFKDVTISIIGAPGAAATGILFVNGINQGTDYNERLGRKIHLRSVAFRGGLTDRLNEADNVYVRVLLVYDSQTNGVLPTAAEILETVTPEAFMNLNNRDRFRIVWERFWSIPGHLYSAINPFAADGTTNPRVEFYKRMRHDVIYSGPTDGIGDVRTGSLIFLVVATPSAGGDSSYQLDGKFRLRFTD